MKKLLFCLLLLTLRMTVNAQPKNNTLPFIDDSAFFPDKNGIYTECEVPPMFNGGTQAYQKYIANNLKWPDKSGTIDVQGKVLISFVVEKNGRLTNFRIIRKLGQPFDGEALRVLKKSPAWIPGKVNGKPVRCRYVIPLNFVMESSDYNTNRKAQIHKIRAFYFI